MYKKSKTTIALDTELYWELKKIAVNNRIAIGKLMDKIITESIDNYRDTIYIERGNV